jgi:hypothetical protein
MKRMGTRVAIWKCALATGLCGSAGVVLAQTSATATVTGRVTESTEVNPPWSLCFENVKLGELREKLGDT